MEQMISIFFLNLITCYNNLIITKYSSFNLDGYFYLQENYFDCEEST